MCLFSVAQCKFIFVLELKDVSLPASLPQPCSVGELVRGYLDIGSIPRRSFFEMLSHFAEDELEREKLQEFCTPEGQVGRTAGQMVGRTAGQMVGRTAGQMVGRTAGQMVGRTAGQMVGRTAGQMVGRMVG